MRMRKPAAHPASVIAWGFVVFLGCSTVLENSGKDVVTGTDTIPTETEALSEVLDVAAPECDILFQDCVIDEGCYLKNDGVGCEPAGSAKEGDPCTFLNSCEPGMACVNLPGGSACALLCATDDDLHDKACKTICTDTFGTLTDVEGVGFCKEKVPIVPCDILKQDCPEGQGCYLSMDGVTCNTTTKGLAVNEDCKFANECAPGLVCINDICSKVCDTSVPPDCPVGKPVCNPIAEAPGAGVCVE